MTNPALAPTRHKIENFLDFLADNNLEIVRIEWPASEPCPVALLRERSDHDESNDDS